MNDTHKEPSQPDEDEARFVKTLFDQARLYNPTAKGFWSNGTGSKKCGWWAVYEDIEDSSEHWRYLGTWTASVAVEMKDLVGHLQRERGLYGWKK